MARDRSDGAVFIDFAASEVGTTLVGDQLIEWQLRGAVDEPMGNRHPVLAPHNSYECEDTTASATSPAGSCWDRPSSATSSGGGWAPNTSATGGCGRPRLGPMQARKAQHNDQSTEPSIDAAIADWARGRTGLIATSWSPKSW